MQNKICWSKPTLVGSDFLKCWFAYTAATIVLPIPSDSGIDSIEDSIGIENRLRDRESESKGIDKSRIGSTLTTMIVTLDRHLPPKQ